MSAKAQPRSISTLHHGRCTIKTSADGRLVTLQTTRGCDIATVGRETAIKIGWLKPNTAGTSKRSKK